MYEKFDTTEKGLRTYSTIFLTISLILAFILFISGSITATQASDEVSSRYSTAAYWSVFLPFLVSIVAIVFVGFFIFLLINALAGIHENTRRTAELLSSKQSAFTNLNVATPAVEKNTATVKTDEWRCNNCNKINKNYVTTFSCGQEKSKN